jgi:Domain of Unknown Function with PDB structure (DUF3857)/Transglutaminase-like superfamily
MKTSSILFMFLLLVISVTAQKLPSFGKINKEDLLYKECNYDKDAPAECLIDYGEANFFPDFISFVSEKYFRIRVKVFNEAGLKQADIRIPYYIKGANNYIAKIRGITYNLSEEGEVEKTELESNSIIKQKINQHYDEMVFSLPNVKPGSVFEYEYTIVRTNSWGLGDWIFQHEIPVRLSIYDAGIPPGLQYKYRLLNIQPVEKKTEQGLSGVMRNIFIMKNIPSLKNEPYISSISDYKQRIEFQLTGYNNRPLRSSTWKGFANLLLDDDDFGKQINKDLLKDIDLLANNLKLIHDPIDKIQTIYKYVQKNIKWNGYNNYWSSYGVKSALEKKEGNSADINLLLINLLRSANIDAYPILVSSRGNGKINIFSPFKEQFTNVYAYVNMPEGPFVMNAANKNTPFFITPLDVQFTNGFLVDKEIGKTIPIFDIKHKYKSSSIATGEITHDGNLQGNAKIYAGEYAKIGRLAFLQKGKEEYKKIFFTNIYPKIVFDSILLNYESNDSSSIENSFKFRCKLDSSGEYLFFNPAFLFEFNKNPFLNENRYSDIEFGYKQNYMMTAKISYPDLFETEELPENLKLTMPDSSITFDRIIQKDEKTLSYKFSLEFKKSIYFSDSYSDLKSFFTKLLQVLNEQIVFRKKIKP